MALKHPRAGDREDCSRQWGLRRKSLCHQVFSVRGRHHKLTGRRWPEMRTAWNIDDPYMDRYSSTDLYTVFGNSPFRLDESIMLATIPLGSLFKYIRYPEIRTPIEKSQQLSWICLSVHLSIHPSICPFIRAYLFHSHNRYCTCVKIMMNEFNKFLNNS